VAVLAGVAEGKSDTAIAATLFWPLYRVERTLETVFTKLGLTDPADVDPRVAAALIYLRG
jgi:DNA-binding NarL/FixJ family response regulator